jgi:AcrR family transcriptional regulator
MTRGAIYGNFANREELFLAVVQTRWKPVAPHYTPGTTFRQHMHAVGKAVAEAGPERRAQALGALSFMLFALTHEDMRAQVAKLNAEIYKAHGGRPDQGVPATRASDGARAPDSRASRSQ